ncbi:MAG: hypothetical protein LBL07_00520 [Tannerella sp.]|nr:hypothetical protein [Tannerella sp.]
MKRTDFKLTAILSVCLMISLLSCENMNSIHEKYYDRGETLYIGVADSVKVLSGFHKIGFEWKINTDPRITQTVIYWNRRDTSVTIPVARTTEGEMWLKALLNDIDEGEYIFEFEMQDDNGHISKSTEVAGAVLGDIYVENLRNRGVKEIAKLETGNMQITWEAVSATANTLLYSVVEYVDSEGRQMEREVPNDEDVTLLPGLETGDDINIYTIHLPENGLETFMSLRRRFTMPKFERELAKSRFEAAFKPGDNTTPAPGDSDGAWANTWPVGDNRDIRQLWDNNTRNDAVNGRRGILHTNDQSTQWANARFKFPHKFTIDIGTLATLSRLHLWPRTDNGSFTGHSPRYFEIWATDVPKEISDFENQAAYEAYYRTTYAEHRPVDNQIRTNPNGDAAHSADGPLFIAPAPAPGTYNWQQDWIKLGDFECEKPSAMNHNQRNDADNAIWQEGFDFSFPETGKKVRYIRLVLKYPNWDHTNCINLGEITLYGDDI